MLRQRLCYFPGDRGAEGLALTRPVRENVAMATLDEAAIASGHVTAQQFDAWVVPADMVGRSK